MWSIVGSFQHIPHGTPKFPLFLGSPGVTLPGSKQGPITIQIGQDHCGKFQLTGCNSQLPGRCLVGVNQEPSDDLNVLQCSAILGGALPGSKQITDAAQLCKIAVAGFSSHVLAPCYLKVTWQCPARPE